MTFILLTICINGHCITSCSKGCHPIQHWFSASKQEQVHVELYYRLLLIEFLTSPINIFFTICQQHIQWKYFIVCTKSCYLVGSHIHSLTYETFHSFILWIHQTLYLTLVVRKLYLGNIEITCTTFTLLSTTSHKQVIYKWYIFSRKINVSISYTIDTTGQHLQSGHQYQLCCRPSLVRISKYHHHNSKDSNNRYKHRTNSYTLALVS